MSSSGYYRSGAPRLHRPSTPPAGVPEEVEDPTATNRQRLSFGVVCSSNINRSMEAHLVLENAGLKVQSYGTGTQVRLPGRTAMEPRIFKFGTPYSDMYQSLAATPEDAAYFTNNGVLQLCRRGAAVKRAPQRWQDVKDNAIREHDVVIAFEERIFDAVVEDLQLRQPTQNFGPMHIICLDTKDNPTEAAIQGLVTLDLCWRLEEQAKAAGGENDDENMGMETAMAEVIEQFQQEREALTPIKVLYQLCYL